jgi:hypothetical protein
MKIHFDRLILVLQTLVLAVSVVITAYSVKFTSETAEANWKGIELIAERLKSEGERNKPKLDTFIRAFKECDLKTNTSPCERIVHFYIINTSMVDVPIIDYYYMLDNGIITNRMNVMYDRESGERLKPFFIEPGQIKGFQYSERIFKKMHKQLSGITKVTFVAVDIWDHEYKSEPLSIELN